MIEFRLAIELELAMNATDADETAFTELIEFPDRIEATEFELAIDTAEIELATASAEACSWEDTEANMADDTLAKLLLAAT